jgi:diaminohydroxyphosphoribosylaminopyrimidine deaminase/5-amino-6-(5-phosphoribosylamino)uracil reductase
LPRPKPSDRRSGCSWKAAGAAAAFLKADMVDRLLLYRAPILVGPGLAAVANLGLETLDAAHGRWDRNRACQLGSDTLTIYHRRR